MKKKDIILNGLIRQNPIFKLVLGTCPTLALTTALSNGIGMGLAVTFVLTCSNVVISLLRKVIPDKVRIPAFVLVIATFVTVVQLVMAKFLPDLYDSLGVFLPLIVVNCLILARAEAFASVNGVLDSAIDGVSMGLGYMASMCIMCTIREVLGKGELLGMHLWDFKIAFFANAAGAFFTFGVLIALFTWVSGIVERKAKQKQYAAEHAVPVAAETAEVK